MITVDGSVILVKAAHPLNVYADSVVKLDGIVIDERLEQPLNA